MVRSLEAVVEIVVFWLSHILITQVFAVNLTLKIEGKLFPHDTLVRDNTPQYQVWL